MNDSVQCIKSELLDSYGMKHGWFMRYGGVSDGPFASLNGKKGNGDIDANVDENRKRALIRLGIDGKDLVHIYHSFQTAVLLADGIGEFMGYDASITNHSDIVLSQTTADCASLIIASEDGKVAALVHGSWHTLKDKIICKVVAKMKTLTDSSLVAAIGPMICSNCYEFGDEAVDLFEEKYLKKHNKKYYVNLRHMVIDQLRSTDIIEVDDVNICTKEDERFFSHRRSGAESGRFITLVSLVE